jgi:hypothetical protein
MPRACPEVPYESTLCIDYFKSLEMLMQAFAAFFPKQSSKGRSPWCFIAY